MFRKYHWTISWLLVATMTLSPPLAYCQSPSDAEPVPAAAGQATTPAEPVPAAAKPGLDLSYVTPKAAAAIVAYPRRLLTDPAMDMLPIEVLTALGEREFGIDPVQIEQLLAITEPPQDGPPGAVAVLRLAAPLPEDKLHAPRWDHTVEGQLDGKTYRRGEGPMDLSIFRVDDRTVLVGTDLLLRKVVSNHANPKPGAMSKLLGSISNPPDLMAIVLIEPLRPLVAMPLAMVPLPPPLADVRKIPNLVTSVGLKVNVTGGPSVTLAVRANDEAAAEQLQQIIDKLLATARQQVAAATAEGLQSSDPVEQAAAKYGQRMSDRLLPLLRPVRKGSSFTLTADLGKNPQTSFSLVAVVAVLTPLAVFAASWAVVERRQALDRGIRELKDDADEPRPPQKTAPRPAQPVRPGDDGGTDFGHN